MKLKSLSIVTVFNDVILLFSSFDYFCIEHTLHVIIMYFIHILYMDTEVAVVVILW